MPYLIKFRRTNCYQKVQRELSGASDSCQNVQRRLSGLFDCSQNVQRKLSGASDCSQNVQQKLSDAPTAVRTPNENSMGSPTVVRTSTKNSANLPTIKKEPNPSGLTLHLSVFAVSDYNFMSCTFTPTTPFRLACIRTAPGTMVRLVMLALFIFPCITIPSAIV